MNAYDTIAAVSTPRGKGGIAVVRVSGEGTRALISRVFTPLGKAPQAHPRRACFGKIHTPVGTFVDEGIVTFFAAPASFTGEDVAEIACHGGILVTEAVLAAVLSAGARMAEAGEFTARAVMCGKMGLSTAESLGALLDAGTKGQLALARGGLTGRLADAARDIYGTLTAILADVYAKIDFPDEDLASMNAGELRTALAAVRTRIQVLADTWHTGRAVAEGIETVICGPVNAGKSTLYNALVGYDAAIVTDIAGTTRDTLTETVSLGNVTLRLSDTAGLRDTADVVERIGVERADAAMERAELVLAVFDGSREQTDDERELVEYIKGLDATKIAIINKSDIGCLPEYEVLANGFEYGIKISALKGEGYLELCELVEQIYIDKNLDTGNDAMIVNARQNAAISSAMEAVNTAAESVRLGLPLEVCCADIESAMQSLSELDGRAVSEDVVSEIFSKFCVGK